MSIRIFFCSWTALHQRSKYTILIRCKFRDNSILLISILKSEDDSNSMELISPLLYAFWSFAPIFMYCEFGNAVTDEFESFSDELCQCKWYSLPIELQKMMVVFIEGTQEPIIVRGFCNIVCIRDSFKKVTSFFIFYFRSKWFIYSVTFFILFRQLMRDFHTLSHFNEWMVECWIFNWIKDKREFC